MLFVLDTDMLSLFSDGHPRVTANVIARSAVDIAITVVTVEEFLTGWYTELRRAKTPQRLADVYDRLTTSATVIGCFRVISFGLPAIAQYDQLKPLRLNIGKMDLRIAAIALEVGATDLTRNTRDFGRVPGLMVEDWSV